jgi:tetratricopeptide (TPR) repeat protein
MLRRCLVGPVSKRFADRHLLSFRQSGQCLAFGPEGPDVVVRWGDRWPAICQRLPSGWQPDFILLCLAYTRTPPGFAAAPVPVVGYAPDWPILWHVYRHAAAWCDRLWTDIAGTRRLAEAGCNKACAVLPFGHVPDGTAEPSPEAERDLDVLFAGNLNPAIHRDRLPWIARLARLARLAGRWRVLIQESVDAERCVPLFRRAKIVFQQSLHGAWDALTPAALAAGALLFREAGAPSLWPESAPGRNHVAYTAGDLEALLERYLTDDKARQEVAASGQVRAIDLRTEFLWPRAIASLESGWEELAASVHRRLAAPLPPRQQLAARVWQAVSAGKHPEDDGLERELREAIDQAPPWAEGRNGLGTLLTRGDAAAVGQAAALFGQASAAGSYHPMAALNRVETLVRLQQRDEAILHAGQLLSRLEQNGSLPPEVLEACHAPPGFDEFRVAWERAAWESAAQPAVEAAAKGNLIRYRLHQLLAQLTGEQKHFHEALRLRPDLPSAHAALGDALVRTGQSEKALSHLERALSERPFDAALARQLFAALGHTGRRDAQRRLVEERRLLTQAAPTCLKAEPWFTSPPQGSGVAGAEVLRRPGALHRGVGVPPPRPPLPQQIPAASTARVSCCLIVRNEEQNLGPCLDSVRDLVTEILVVDTGSTDRTREVAAQRGARVIDFAWCDDFAAARNESLTHATGSWIFWLDADERLDEPNRQRLRQLFARLRDTNDAYLMRQLSRSPEAVGATTAVDHVRLFRNRPDVRWEYRIHEQILLSLRRSGAALHTTDIVIDHFGYQDPSLRQGKLERNLRLLELAYRERPEDPILAFNLAWALHKTSRPEEALPLLELCRDRLPPDVSIVPKVYRLLGQLHQQAGRSQQALTAFQTGRALFATDVELLLHEGLLRRQLRDYGGAESCLRRILTLPATSCLGGLDLGLRGYKTRHALAELYLEQRRFAEAETEWQQVVAEQPGFGPAWLGLGQSCLALQKWDALEQILVRLDAAGVDASRLREGMRQATAASMG